MHHDDEPHIEDQFGTDRGYIELSKCHNRFVDEDDGDDILNESGSVKKKKKQKNKKRRKKDKGDAKDTFDDSIWAQMEIKVEEIVRSADLNTLTNREVKDKLKECFEGINIKIYKAFIKVKINSVACSICPYLR